MIKLNGEYGVLVIIEKIECNQLHPKPIGEHREPLQERVPLARPIPADGVFFFFNDTATTEIYTNSTKNGDPLNTYTYGPGTLTPKDDIGNIYAIFRITPTGTPEIYFGGERVINNGDSHFDFEFLQSKLTATPSAAGSCAGVFAGHRTQGDFLLSVDFPQAFGAPPALSVREWHCDNETTKKGDPVTQPPVGTVCDPGTANASDPNWNPHYQDISALPKAQAVTLASNVNDLTNGCGGWVCRDEIPKVYDPHFVSSEELMEGGVNLGSL